MRKNYVTILALAFLLPGCRYYGDFWKNQKPSAKNSGPFAVTSVLPASGATNVATNTSITVTFNRSMNTGTVTAQSGPGTCTDSVQLSADSFATCLGILSITWNGDNTVATIILPSALAASTTHALRVLTTVSSSAGEFPAAEFNSTFVTGTVADVTPPSTPGTPAATPISTSQIDLAWSAATDDMTPQVSLVYNICRSTTPGGCSAFTTVATTAAGALNFSDTGLSPLTTYYYRIQAQDLATNAGTPTVEFSGTTLSMGSASTPTYSPIAGVFGATQNVAISTATGGATICYTANGTDPTCLMGVCTTGTTYAGSVSISTDSTLKALACLNGYTDSAINAGNYVIDTTPPGSPGGAAATPMSLSQLDVSWTAATDNVSIAAAISYEVCMSTTPGTCTAFSVTGTTPPGTTTYSATGLSALTTYYFRVRAKDQVGNVGTATSEFSATTLSSGSVATPTFSPIAGTYGTAQNVTITSATGGATICYTTNGVDPGCSLGFCSGSSTYGAPVSVSTDTTLKAIGCAIGFSNSAVQTGAYVIDMTGPTTPGTPSASPISTTQLSLTWSMSSDNTTPMGSIVYEVCQVTTPGGCSAFTVSATTGPGATGYSASALTPGTTYYFSVRARDQFNNLGTPTAEFSAATQSLPQVLATTPADNTPNVPVNSPIVITFNKMINTGTATVQPASGACTGSLQISSDNFATCIGILSVNWDGTQEVATLVPAQPLQFLTQHRILVLSSVTDTFGNPMAVNFTTPIGFMTKAADPATLDLSFNPGTGTDNAVNAIELQMGDRIVIGGLFLNYNGSPAGRIVRLLADGTRDSSWISGGTDGPVHGLTVLPDDSGFAIGNFGFFGGNSINSIARWLTDDGLNNFTFSSGSGFAGAPNTIGHDSLARLIVGGLFTDYNGSPVNRLVRILPDGNTDGSLAIGSGFDGDVNALVVLPDDSIIVGGAFANYDGSPYGGIVKLEAGGTVDPSFNSGSGVDFRILAMARQSDGKILIGGMFTSYNGTPRARIARINSDGSLDFSFNPGTGADNNVFTIAIQGDGKILIGGEFLNFNGFSRPNFARLNTDGTLDTAFDPLGGPNAVVHAIKIQSDNKILIGGAFASYAGTPRGGIARIHP
ncbi:MAG: Ig-like domain-containing protein [Spirochaetota bacterium]